MTKTSSAFYRKCIRISFLAFQSFKGYLRNIVTKRQWYWTKYLSEGFFGQQSLARSARYNEQMCLDPNFQIFIRAGILSFVTLKKSIDCWLLLHKGIFGDICDASKMRQNTKMLKGPSTSFILKGELCV